MGIIGEFQRIAVSSLQESLHLGSIDRSKPWPLHKTQIIRVPS